MSDPVAVTPAKVQFIAADETSSDVNGVIEGATVHLDPDGRSVRISGPGREEKGSIEGDLIASARGLKITCGQDDGVRKSLHLAFTERSELDKLLERLQDAGLSVIRALDEDPEIRLTEEAASSERRADDGDTNEGADEKATVLQPSGEPVEDPSSK